jgi:hypothetical protein
MKNQQSFKKRGTVLPFSSIAALVLYANFAVFPAKKEQVPCFWRIKVMYL